MKKGVVKIDSRFNEIESFKNFSVIGDPGCDGLGASIMSTFAKSLAGIESDFKIILGDIVPLGSKKFYDGAADFINAVSNSPVYALCGNHDTDFYGEYFGLKNYTLASPEVLFIILDNSSRVFSGETLDFLKDALEKYSRENIILLFHIPPPNRFTKNSMSEAEWEKAAVIIRPYIKKIKYILSGHLHSFFEDETEGVKLLVSGGGGARIEFVDGSIDSMKAFHHCLNFYFMEGELLFEHITLDGRNYEAEVLDETLRGFLMNAFKNECAAHLKYKFYAMDARSKGMEGVSRLFAAASDAEFYHAMNHFKSLNGSKTVAENLRDSFSGEDYEVSVMYREYLEYARKNNFGLAAYSFLDALEAEKVHRSLFEKAMADNAGGSDIAVSAYHTCVSCGHTFHAGTAPKNCPVCGAPRDNIIKVE